MGNSLLDFVMALVRDPETAARYAADPAGVLADAQLPGVTITDVANLIPVVADSLAMATPDFGVVADTANVWTTGAATAALDAFAVPHPAPIGQPDLPQVNTVDVGEMPAIPDMPEPEPAPVGADPTLECPPAEPAGQEWADDRGWRPEHDSQVADHDPAGHPGFDLF